MRKSPFLCLLAVIMLSACQQHSSNSSTTTTDANDTIAYTSAHLYKYVLNNKDTTYVAMNYPVFSGSTPFEKLLTKSVAMQLTMSDSIQLSAEAYIDSFLKQYSDFIAKNKDYTLSWSEDVNMTVRTNTSHHFSFEHSRTAFTGGAHGNSFLGYSNFDRKNNRMLRLEDVIEEGSIDKLTAIAEPLFRAEQEIADSISLEDAGYFVFDEKDKGKFRLNRNFILLKDGIQFFYNDYEIAPHAVGTSTVFIPYTKMDGILKEDFVL